MRRRRMNSFFSLTRPLPNETHRLCQDEEGPESRRLSRWFASRPGVRYALRAALPALPRPDADGVLHRADLEQSPGPV